MALPSDFSKIFGATATGGLTPIADVDYAKGWEYVGSNPPTKNDFSYLQNFSDLKSQWLYNYITTATNAASRTVGIGTNQIPDMASFTKSFGVSGYQKLPGGLVIQWGNATTSTTGTTHNYPIAFPNSAFIIVASDSGTSSLEYIAVAGISLSQFSAKASSNSPGFNYFAIGN